MMNKARPEEAGALTKVFWDIKMCPVPDGYNSRQVRPCIKRFLENNGYYGPLTVIAYGKLGDVPIDMLRGVFASGIDLNLLPYGSQQILDIIDLFDQKNPPPGNFMVISDPKVCPDFSRVLRRVCYNPIQPFPYHSLESLLFMEKGPLVEETRYSPLWDCSVCSRYGKCFESFVTHLSDEEHLEEMILANNMRPPHSPVLNPMEHSRDDLTRCNVETVRIVNAPVRVVRGYHLTDWKAVKSSGETLVFWDINSCPVPPGCDASLVGPHIRRFLTTRRGCSGPLSITAIGVLTDVPNDILRKVCSTGISLYNVPYGPSDTANLIDDIYYTTGPLLNIMVISDAKIFACLPRYLKLRFNLLKPFPLDSLEFFFRSDSVELEDFKCSDSPSSFCSVCDKEFRRQNIFIKHLSEPFHQLKLSKLLPLSHELRSLSAPSGDRVKGNPEAVTSVFWDINTYPVPPDCDPRQVGPCIKQSLKNIGYSGPLTITAIGVLKDVPNYILEGVYSSGVSLNNICSGFSDTVDRLICEFTVRNPPPANIMFMSDVASDYSFQLEARGYKILQPAVSFRIFHESFFLDDETSDSAFWTCSVCDYRLRGQGFENFTTHVTSRRHERKLLDAADQRFTRRE